ncbi:type II toxin-antitoxin system RelE/ParE family toxin [Mucilaginibacter sp.]
MPLIKLLKRAEIELTDACKWYEKQQKGLSYNFRMAIKKSLNAIALNPAIFEKRFGTELRFALVYKFPYVVIYWYDEDLDTIFPSIFHTKRNPESFKNG